MPRKPKRPCRKPGCPALIEGGGYCDKHMPKDTRPSAAKRGYGSKWRTYREAYLRTHRWCVLCSADGRRTRATVVDHTIPHKGDMKAFWKKSNHQALCKQCHDRKTAKYDGAWGRKPVGSYSTGNIGRPGRNDKPGVKRPIVLVCGPPGSGKTTYVMERIKRGDVVVDLDALAVALSGLEMYDKPATVMPFAYEARDAVLDKLAAGDKATRAWVIAGLPRATDRAEAAKRFGAEAVVLDIDREECVRRIGNDSRRAGSIERWTNVVDQWWADYKR